MGTALGIAGAVIGVSGIVIGLWVARRSSIDVRGTITLLGLAGLDQDFEVQWRGQPVKVPSLVNIRINNMGPKDVSVRDFEGGTLQTSYTDARAVGILSDGTSDPDAWELTNDTEREDAFRISLRPRILKSQEPATVTLLCDGTPQRSETLIRLAGVRELSRRRKWFRKYGFGFIMAFVVGIVTALVLYYTTAPRDPSRPRVELTIPERLWGSALMGVLYGAVVIYFTWGRRVLRIRRNKSNHEEDSENQEPRKESAAFSNPEAASDREHPDALREEKPITQSPSTDRSQRTTRRRLTPSMIVRAAASYQEILSEADIQVVLRADSGGVLIDVGSVKEYKAVIRLLTPEYREYGVPYKVRVRTPEEEEPNSKSVKTHPSQN